MTPDAATVCRGMGRLNARRPSPVVPLRTRDRPWVAPWERSQRQCGRRTPAMGNPSGQSPVRRMSARWRR